MPERSDAGAEHVGPMPESVAVYELRLFLVAHHRVSARDFISSPGKFIERIIDPFAFGRPISDGQRWLVLTNYFQFLGKAGIEWQFHLIDGHAFRRHADSFAHAVAPVVPIFAHHAGNQIDIDLIKTN